MTWYIITIDFHGTKRPKNFTGCLRSIISHLDRERSIQ